MITEQNNQFQAAETAIRHFIQNELVPNNVAADGLELAGLEAILMDFIEKVAIGVLSSLITGKISSLLQATSVNKKDIEHERSSLASASTLKSGQPSTVADLPEAIAAQLRSKGLRASHAERLAGRIISIARKKLLGKSKN